MNIKRGFFRFWIVLSVLWLVVEGTIQVRKLEPYPPHSNVTVEDATQAIKTAIAYNDGSISRRDCEANKASMESGPLQYDGYINCTQFQERPPKDPFLGLLFLKGATLIVRDCYSGYEDIAQNDVGLHMINCQIDVQYNTSPDLVVALIHSMEADKTKAVNSAWRKAFIFLFLPPLALLLLWWMLIWVIKGFKAKTT